MPKEPVVRRRTSFTSRVVAFATVAGVLVAGLGVYLPIANDRSLFPFAGTGPTPAPSATTEVCDKATIAVTPNRGPVGTSATVDGCGFGPAEEITVSTASQTVADTRTDAGGRFHTSFAVVSRLAGGTDKVLTVIAVGSTSQRTAFTDFTVTPA